MRTHTTRVIIITLLVGLTGLSIWYVSRPQPVKVKLKQVTQGTVEKTITNTRAGTIVSCKRARLAPATGGQISQLLVKEGDQVSAQQLLMEIWNDDLKSRILLARQEVRASRLKSRETCVNYQVAEKEARRLKSLFKKKLVSDEDSDRAVGSALAKKAACEASKATILVTLAQVKLTEALLQRTQLKAPFAGIIAEVNGEVGEFATPSPIGVSTLPNIDLLDKNCLYVSAPIDEVDAPELINGMPARITLDAFREKSFTGKIRRIAAYVLDIEKQARTVDIEVDFIQPDDMKNLLPGYSADVEVIIKKKENTLRVPTEAVQNNNNVLFYNSATGVLERKSFVKGVSNWVFTEVISGLKKGDQIVISLDRKGVEPGAAVIPEN
ncbi:MAG: efflux RND transporter periplasmic adaptor subunit [Gammaproteobacteria bacterium]|nr:efflux RND transporter periplasmic adaptor subunit [Gammaproteobacteria bacterium]